METLKIINESKSYLFDCDFMDDAIKDLEDSEKQVKDNNVNDYMSPEES